MAGLRCAGDHAETLSKTFMGDQSAEPVRGTPGLRIQRAIRERAYEQKAAGSQTQLIGQRAGVREFPYGGARLPKVVGCT